MLDTNLTSVLNCPMMPQCYHATMPRCHYATIQPIQRCTMQCLNNHKLHNNSQLFIQSNVTFTLRKIFATERPKKLESKNNILFKNAENSIWQPRAELTFLRDSRLFGLWLSQPPVIRYIIVSIHIVIREYQSVTHSTIHSIVQCFNTS